MPHVGRHFLQKFFIAFCWGIFVKSYFLQFLRALGVHSENLPKGMLIIKNLSLIRRNYDGPKFSKFHFEFWSEFNVFIVRQINQWILEKSRTCWCYRNGWFDGWRTRIFSWVVIHMSWLDANLSPNIRLLICRQKFNCEKNNENRTDQECPNNNS